MPIIIGQINIWTVGHVYKTNMDFHYYVHMCVFLMQDNVNLQVVY